MAANVVVRIPRGTTLTNDQQTDLFATAIRVRYAEELKKAQPALRDQLARQLAKRLLDAHVSCSGGYSEAAQRIALSDKTADECRDVERIMADLVLIREVDPSVLPTFTDKVENWMKYWAGKGWSLFNRRSEAEGPTGGGVRG